MKKLKLKLDDIQEKLTKETMKEIVGGDNVPCYHNDTFCGYVDCEFVEDCASACLALIAGSGC